MGNMNAKRLAATADAGDQGESAAHEANPADGGQDATEINDCCSETTWTASTLKPRIPVPQG